MMQPSGGVKDIWSFTTCITAIPQLLSFKPGYVLQVLYLFSETCFSFVASL